MPRRIQHGDIRRFADATRYHLRSAHQILSVLFIDKGPGEEGIETLLRQLEVGIPAEALRLLELLLPLSRGEYLALFGRGMRSPENVWMASIDDIAAVLGSERADQLLKMKPK